MPPKWEPRLSLLGAEGTTVLSISHFRHPGLTKAIHVHGYNVRRKMPNPCLPFRDCGIGVKLDHPGDRFARLLDKTKLHGSDHLAAKRAGIFWRFLQRSVRPFQRLLVSSGGQIDEGKATAEVAAERIEGAKSDSALECVYGRIQLVLSVRHISFSIPRMSGIGVQCYSALDETRGCSVLAREINQGNSRHPQRIGVVLTPLDRLFC